MPVAADLVALLRGQQTRKVDVVAPASAIRAEGGMLVLDGTEPVLGPDGVTMTTGRYQATDVAMRGSPTSSASLPLTCAGCGVAARAVPRERERVAWFASRRTRG